MTQMLRDPQQFVAELKALLTRWDAELDIDYDYGRVIVAYFNLQCDFDGNVIRKQCERNLGRTVKGT